MLSASEVSLIYGLPHEPVYAVREISLRIEPGEFVGIVGPSGSGKSSLLYLLSGLKRPTQGEVAFEGRQYAELGEGLVELRRRRFGFVFQLPFLLNYLTVWENVLVGALAEDRAARAWIGELLGRLRVGELQGRFPYQLSVGQRQRVAIARALANHPAVVFADEPTASLDQRTGRKVLDLLVDCQRITGTTLVLATHDPLLVEKADRVLRLSEGRLIHETA